MPYVLVRHKVADFSKWKAVYDAHLPARKEAGFIKEVHLLRNADDPNETIIMFEVESLQKARDFSASSDLRETMQKAGVVDKPDIYFLEQHPRSSNGAGLGDARFSNIEGSDPDEPRVCDRAGYWKQIGDKRIFLLRSDALLDAAKGHDLTEIGNALKSAGALYKNGDGDHLALARTVSTNSVGLSFTAPSRFAALNTIRKLFT